MTNITKFDPKGMTSVQNPPELQNGHATKENGSVDDHFAYFRAWYDHANNNFLVQKAKNGYQATKSSNALLERTLDGLEGKVIGATEYAAPLYANYCYPTTDRVAKLYSNGYEKTATTLNATKSVVQTSGTVGVGLVVMSTQLGLIASAAMTSLLLDGVILTKNVGTGALNKTIELEKAVEQRIHVILDTARRAAQVPADKITESTNSLLDVLNTVADNFLHLPIEEDTIETPDMTIGQRIYRLTQRIVRNVHARAKEDLVEPSRRQLHSLIEQLSKSITLVNYAKQKQGKVTGQLSSSLSELYSTLETEARGLKVNPEELLLRYIRRSSSLLNQQLKNLRVKGNQIQSWPPAVVQRLDAATSYVEQLDSTFENAKDIHEVKNELLEEAKQKLQDIRVLWTSTMFPNSQQANKSEQENNGTELNKIPSDASKSPKTNGTFETNPTQPNLDSSYNSTSSEDHHE